MHPGQAAEKQYKIVAIGVSIGGLKALETLLSSLPPDFALPVAIAQHRSLDDVGRLAGALRRLSVLPLCDADDKQPIESGKVYLAPPDYHLLVEDGHFALSIEPPVMHARPSIDMLFESAAEAYGGATIGVVLTGANRDGVHGAVRIKEAGGYVIVQDPATAFNPSLPKAVLAGAAVDRVLPLEQIGEKLGELSRRTHG